MKRVLICLVCLLHLASVQAQRETESDEAPLLNATQGVRFQKDSLYAINMRFRMQNRFFYESEDGANLSPSSLGFLVRRLRFRLDGFLFDPRLAYYIQLSFSRNDLGLTNSDVAEPIRDAMIYYHFSPKFYIGFGQSKLPGNRQRVVSSGNLQLPERSPVNNLLTLDRDVGVFFYATLPLGQQVVRFKGAISSGEGRNALPRDAGLAYTLRAEWLPLGKFKNSGDYSEGALEDEDKPKVSIALGGHFNQWAIRQAGTHGIEMQSATDFQALFADIAFKYKGWSLMSEAIYKTGNLPAIGILPILGHGILVQAGKMLGKKTELVLRWAQFVPNPTVELSYPQRSQSGLGFNWYIKGHRIKSQLFFGYEQLGTRWDLNHTGNQWLGQFQVEFGI
jgi:phosphate-selective porin OprO and OprP